MASGCFPLTRLVGAGFGDFWGDGSGTFAMALTGVATGLVLLFAADAALLSSGVGSDFVLALPLSLAFGFALAEAFFWLTSSSVAYSHTETMIKSHIGRTTYHWTFLSQTGTAKNPEEWRPLDRHSHQVHQPQAMEKHRFAQGVFWVIAPIKKKQVLAPYSSWLAWPCTSKPSTRYGSPSNKNAYRYQSSTISKGSSLVLIINCKLTSLSKGIIPAHPWFYGNMQVCK